jgi:lysozyme
VLFRTLLVAVSTVLALAQPTPATAASLPPSQYGIDGIDVASWQHPGGRAIDWRRVRAANVNFATVKATEGSTADDTGYTNPYLTADLEGARAAGLAVAPYHFYLGRSPRTGAAQADYFIAAVRRAGYTGQRRGDLPPVFDFEWDWKGGCPPHVTVNDARAWLYKVRAAFGRTPVIYTSRSFVRTCLGGSAAFAGYPLQVASYNGGTRPDLPRGWTDWTMWQWTTSACVDGIRTCRLTRTILRGSERQLAELANRA